MFRHVAQSCDLHKRQQKAGLRNSTLPFGFVQRSDVSITAKMKSLVLFLSLFGLSLALKFPGSTYNSKACYQPEFDKGIKEVM